MAILFCPARIHQTVKKISFMRLVMFCWHLWFSCVDSITFFTFFFSSRPFRFLSNLFQLSYFSSFFHLFFCWLLVYFGSLFFDLGITIGLGSHENTKTRIRKRIDNYQVELVDTPNILSELRPLKALIEISKRLLIIQNH